MAKARAPRRTLESYTVKPINKSIQAGDCVLMRPSDPSKPSYVARIERIESDSRGANVKVYVRWYYRPEESIGGRRQFHGSKELFLSDHYDVQSADTIEGKCTVHTFKSYTKLDAVGNDDFFCRFEYNSTTGAFNPDRVAVYVVFAFSLPCVVSPLDFSLDDENIFQVTPFPFPFAAVRSLRKLHFNLLVSCHFSPCSNCCRALIDARFFHCCRYCKCEMPYNPDDLMVQCEGCSDWFHPACIEMTAEEAQRLDHFFCENCSAEGKEKLQNSHASSRNADAKVDTKRLRRW
ncbi:hypothetical protein SAY86_030689 [Trapa natans]|uniref:Uncharacterized protein n=1 Tax=Trapa natans TaxID=22666 RepID=A0AAN7RIQ1_TRANT|nr:hypothetical protein SAY86_030689 [Trapa natans]